MSRLYKVSRREPCRVCGKPDWCRVSADGGLAVCNRVESPRPARGNGGGWLHRTDTPHVAVSPPTAAAERTPGLSPAELALIDRQCRTIMSPESLDRLARGLNVSAATLATFGVGWHSRMRAYTWPMHDAAGRLVGLRTRYADGRKRCVPGGRLGLVLPAVLRAWLASPPAEPPDVLLVCEGESDAAAAAELGQLAVGRPGCGACGETVSIIARRLRPGRVVLLADHDAPGQRGAATLARRLADAGIGCDVLTLPDVKDLREWKARPGNDCHALAALLDAPPDRTE